MKKQLLALGIAAFMLTVSTGSVQAKEIKNPVQHKKPEINRVVHKNNYSINQKHLAKLNKKTPYYSAYKNTPNRYSSKYNKRIAKVPKQSYKLRQPKYNVGHNYGNFKNNNLTAQNKGNWNYGVNNLNKQNYNFNINPSPKQI